MAGLNSWLSPDVTHALGWTLIHSLWQCLAVAALAAVLMAISRRPSVRYLIATGALAAMLAAPVATFLVLLRPAAPVQASHLSALIPRLLAQPAATIPPAGAEVPAGALTAKKNDVAIALEDPSKPFLAPRFLSSDLLSSNILPWLVVAWLCGVALCSLRFAGGFLLLDYKRRSQSSIPSPRILALCRTLQHQLGLNRAIRYLQCGWLQAPAVIGWIRPIVLLPVSVLTGLNEAQLRAVIAHELAHIRRHDFFVNLLQILLETLLFYHPAIWWLNRRIRIERELCCDEIAVSLTGDRLEYVRALMIMEEWEQAPALAMAVNRSPLTERVFHILDRKPFCAGQRLLGLTGGLLFLAAALGAANALFGIAYPISMAQAEASLNAVVPSNRIAADQIAPQAPHATTPAVKDAFANQSISNRDTDQEFAEPVHTDTTTVQAEKLQAATPQDLSRLLPKIAPVTLALAASNEPPLAPAQPAANPSPAPVSAPGDQSGPFNSAQLVPAKAINEAPPGLLNSLPMQKVPGSDTMTITATIDGHPEKLLVGIADMSTQLWNRQAKPLDLPVREGRRAMDAGGRFSNQVAQVAKFTLGSMHTGYFDIQISPDPEFANSGTDGVLSTDMMMRYDIDLDFAHRRMNYFSPDQCNSGCIYWAPSKINSIRMETYAGVVYVPVTLDGHKIIAALDTSADRTFLNPQVARKLFGLKAGSLKAGNVADGGALIKAGMHTFFSLTFGGLTFSNPQIAVPFDVLSQSTHDSLISRTIPNRFHLSQILPDMIVGMDVLKHSHLYISFDNRRVYVSAAGDGRALKPPPIKSRWFNVWKYGYDTYLHPYRHPAFGL